MKTSKHKHSNKEPEDPPFVIWLTPMVILFSIMLVYAFTQNIASSDKSSGRNGGELQIAADQKAPQPMQLTEIKPLDQISKTEQKAE